MTIIERVEIRNALKCLKEMCASYKTCANCPAYVGHCQIKYTDPCDYELNTVDDNIWRAFK